MKAIRTKEVNENVKAANSCLRKAKWQAKELAILSWEDKRPFEEKQIAVENLLKEFCKLNGGVIYE